MHLAPRPTGSAGLVDVQETAIAMDLPFQSFSDFWDPHLRGVAPQVSLPTILRGSMPFVLIMLAFMVFMSFFPGIATWLPDKLMGPA